MEKYRGELGLLTSHSGGNNLQSSLHNSRKHIDLFGPSSMVKSIYLILPEVHILMSHKAKLHP
ncbi:hypothetical protein [Bacillus sp. OV322]|uniref:hypothetical protein n=1 Tax=Bacillus sp. OV322 TaxID=1882764 RepID=UPI000B81A9C3|nr:hypothetical protein [Bacillus sp. OV322]